MTRSWTESAPSNIALIKYMGKTDHAVNEATNGSISLTLPQFQSTVEITETKEGAAQDVWEPLATEYPLPSGVGDRFLSFFHRLKSAVGLEQQFFRIRSGNNFPSDAGLASSASSFAALTMAAESCFAEVQNRARRADAELAAISRTGSGSSCRSFFGPWCVWEGEAIAPLPATAMPRLTDFVVVCGSGHKAVSSSQAHKLVASSPLFSSRLDRLPARLATCKTALASGDWDALRSVAWEDMWEMHSLFHTSRPPFFYFSPETIEVLRFVEEAWRNNSVKPIATIDAGPNVHLLVPTSNAAEFRRDLEKTLGSGRKAGLPLRILESEA